MDPQKKDTAKVADGEGTEYSAAGLQVVGNHVKQRFGVAKSNRRIQEQQWLKNLYQFKGKYDPEIESSIPVDRSRAYPKLTRTKIMMIVARLMNLLFPQGDKSWGITTSKHPRLSQDELNEAFYEWREENPDAPVTPEELERLVRKFAMKAAERLEDHVLDQLQDSMGSATETDNSDFVTLCRKVIISAAIFNVGILKGPMTIGVTRSTIEVPPGMDEPVVRDIETSRPYFEPVDVWSYYPDMQASQFSTMEGEFETHVYSKHQLERLKKRDDFLSDNIDKYIQRHPDGDFTLSDHEQDLDNLDGNKRATSRGGKYRIVEFWGTISRKFLEKTDIEIPEDFEGMDEIRCTVWLGDGTPLKIAINPLPSHTNIYHKFVFDDAVPGLLGGSMSEIMRDSQMAVSSAARMLIDNASVTCGPNLEIDISKLVGGQDVKSIGSFRNYFVDSGNNPAGHRAINNISIDSHMTELLQVMNTFLEFADMETFVGGENEASNTPGEALRTSAGASMVMGNAALPFRDIVRSFDRFTVSVLNALVEWNRVFNEDLDTIGDLRPVAKGATSLIAKEVRAFALDNLSQTLSDEERIYIDPEKMVRQRLSARDIPELDVMASEEDVKRKQDAQQQEAAEAKDQARQIFEAEMKALATEALKDTAQAKKNMEGADSTSVQTLLKILQSGVEVQKNARQTTKEQAELALAQRNTQPEG